MRSLRGALLLLAVGTTGCVDYDSLSAGLPDLADPRRDLGDGGGAMTGGELGDWLGADFAGDGGSDMDGGGGIGPYPNGSGWPRPADVSTPHLVVRSGASPYPSTTSFAITALDGSGSFEITWSNTETSSHYFHGSLFAPTGGTLDVGTTYGAVGYARRAAADRVDFSSPLAGDGTGGSVVVVSSATSLVVHLFMDGSLTAVVLYYVNASGQSATTVTDPVQLDDAA